MVLYTLMAALLLLLLGGPARAADKYVATTGNDTNPGTLAQPWRNINPSLAKLNPGDTLYVRGGTYAERLTNFTKGGTSESTRTTVSAYNNEVVLIRPTSGSDVVNFSACTASVPCRYWIIHQLIVDAEGLGTGAYAISAGDPDVTYIRWQYGEVRNSYNSGFSGIGAFSEVSHMKVHDNGKDHLRHNFYICSPNITIRDSEIYNSFGHGIQLYYGAGCGTGVKIYNNLIYNNGRECGAGGVTMGSADGLEFFNNVVSDSQCGYGIQLGYGSPNTNLKIYNNTIVNNQGWGIQILSGVQSALVRNTIFYGNDNQVRNLGTGTITFEKNWCGNTGLGCDSSLIGNPLLTAAFKPQAGSPVIDKGVSTAPTVTFDRDNLPRPQPNEVTGKYDLGAYEYPQASTPTCTPTANPVYVKQTGSDTNDCCSAETASTPKKTLASALACMTVAGKHLVIADTTATYDEFIDTNAIPIAAGTNAAAPTVIEGQAGSTITLRLLTGGVGIYAKKATDAFLTFRNLTVDCNSVPSTNGIAVAPGAHDIHFEQVNAHHCDFEGGFFNGAANVVIQGGQFYSNTSHGLAGYGALNGLTIQDVTIYANDLAGIMVPTATGNPTNVVLNRNVIHHNGGIGIDLGTSTGALVQNNILYRNDIGLNIRSGATQTNIYQNTIANNTTIGVRCNSGATSIATKNNIVWGNGTELINNCSFTTAGNVTVDPSFVNSAGDIYTLGPGSAAFNTGENLPSVTMDQLGVPRPQLTFWDAGALESTTDLGGGGAIPDVTVLGRVAFAPLFFF
jgi:nitrous oxidase accessory protein NosD